MKIPVKTHHKFLILLLCLACHGALAQRTPFKYLSRLPKVDSAGYYRINLAPGLTGRSRPDMADVRIVDEKGQFVPYVKSGSLPKGNKMRFVAFPQTNIREVIDSTNAFIAQNITAAPIDQLWLKLKNTTVNRQITITGSDDLKKWFAIAENINLNAAGPNDVKGEFQQMISFPASNYRFLKLSIDNKHKSPIAILGAGIYSYLTTAPKYVPITGLRFTRADSPDHTTHIYIKFDLPYRVDKLSIPIIYKDYFHRQVNVYTKDSSHTWLTSTTLGKDDHEINLSIVTRALDVQIINNDDAPLPVKKISAHQSQSFLVASLLPEHTYSLLTGDPDAQAPKYDLEYFAENLNGSLPETMHQNMQHNPEYRRKAAKGEGENKKGYWLWASIAIAIAILSALTFSMMSEMKKREAEK